VVVFVRSGVPTGEMCPPQQCVPTCEMCKTVRPSASRMSYLLRCGIWGGVPWGGVYTHPAVRPELGGSYSGGYRNGHGSARDSASSSVGSVGGRK
jgi:hypothetical protein